jgi:cellulose synthase/poly-beta-1,6-N-acetylglucosamine synthase-like glycosyltransferase
MTTHDRQARARTRAEAKFGFYKHLAVYLVINILLFLINLTTSPDYFWAIWPLIGWGVAVAFHALTVFVFGQRNQIVERLTEEEMRKDETDRE